MGKKSRRQNPLVGYTEKNAPFESVFDSCRYLDRGLKVYVMHNARVEGSAITFILSWKRVPRIVLLRFSRSRDCRSSRVWDKRDGQCEPNERRAMKNYLSLCTMISRQPGVVSGWKKKRFKGEGSALPTIFYPLIENHYLRNYNGSKFFEF